MAFSLTRFLKGLVVKNETTGAEVEIVPGGTANTKTTITTNQTGNISLSLPSSAGTLATQEYVAAAPTKEDRTLETVSITDYGTPYQLTSDNARALKILEGTSTPATSTTIVHNVLKVLTAGSSSSINYTDGNAYGTPLNRPLDDAQENLTNAITTGSVFELTGGDPESYHDIQLPDVTTIPLGWYIIVRNISDWSTNSYIYSFDTSTIVGPMETGISYRFESISTIDNSPAGWQMTELRNEVRLPDVTTLAVRRKFALKNNTSENISVYTHTSSPVALDTLYPNETRIYECLSIVDNSLTGWSTSGALTVRLPDVTTLNVGRKFTLENTSGLYGFDIDVHSYSGAFLFELPAGLYLRRMDFMCLSIVDNTSTGWEIQTQYEQDNNPTLDVTLTADLILDNTCPDHINVNITTPDTYYVWLPDPETMGRRNIIISNDYGGGGTDVTSTGNTVWLKDHNGSELFFNPDGIPLGCSVLCKSGGSQWRFFALGNDSTIVGEEKMVLNHMGVKQSLNVGNEIRCYNNTRTEDLIVDDGAFINGFIQMDAGGATWPGVINWPNTRVPGNSGGQLDHYRYNNAYTASVVGLTTAGTGTYNNRSLEYVRIGWVVLFTIHLDWTAHTGTGNMKVSGLPANANIGGFNCKYAVTVAHSNIALTAGYTLQAEIDTNTSDITLTQVPVGGGAAIPVPLDTAGKLTLTGWYHTFGA